MDRSSKHSNECGSRNQNQTFDDKDPIIEAAYSNEEEIFSGMLRIPDAISASYEQSIRELNIPLALLGNDKYYNFQNFYPRSIKFWLWKAEEKAIGNATNAGECKRPRIVNANAHNTKYQINWLTPGKSPNKRIRNLNYAIGPFCYPLTLHYYDLGTNQPVVVKVKP